MYAAPFVIFAFWVQYKANIQQRHDIAIERFENNLFEMIHMQQEITNGLLVLLRVVYRMLTLHIII